MTKTQLETLFDQIRSLPPEKQDEVALFLKWLNGRESGIYSLSPEERADLEEALAEMDRGEVASNEEVEAFFAGARKGR
jgi:hypothetical protein